MAESKQTSSANKKTKGNSKKFVSKKASAAKKTTPKTAQKPATKIEKKEVKNAKVVKKNEKAVPKVEQIDAKLGYQFKDRALLTRALTHPSKSRENYQRLEFLGDSILNFLVGEYLFKHSSAQEGELTVVRSHYVSEEHLSQCFDEIGLTCDVICGKSLNGVTRAIKGDIMEAIIAGIYLDSGMSEARNFVIEKLHVADFANAPKDNYKTQLQELVQANFKCAMKYVTIQTDDGFEASFYMDEDLISKGYGKDKIHAEQNCAMVALRKLFEEN